MDRESITNQLKHSVTSFLVAHAELRLASFKFASAEFLDRECPVEQRLSSLAMRGGGS
jgi:hypothetical protein